MGVEHIAWRLDGKVRAWCPECNWRHRGWQGAVNAASVRHVEKTGHRVQEYRAQWKAISPAPPATDQTETEGARDAS